MMHISFIASCDDLMVRYYNLFDDEYAMMVIIYQS